MKERVNLGATSTIITILCIVTFVGIMLVNNPPLFMQILLGAILGAMILSGLYYMPIKVCASSTSIKIVRCLKTKTIPMQEVKYVQPHIPSMGTVRLCGSGGFMGFWGWFREKSTGRYFAYYGRQKDCFLIDLHDGRKYLLGCNNSHRMVAYIRIMIKA